MFIFGVKAHRNWQHRQISGNFLTEEMPLDISILGLSPMFPKMLNF